MEKDSAEELGGVGVEEGDGEKEAVVVEEDDGEGEDGGDEDGEEGEEAVVVEEEEDGEGEDGGVDLGGEDLQEVGCQEVPVIPKEGQETFREVKKKSKNVLRIY